MDRFSWNFGRITVHDFGKNPLNFGHDLNHDPEQNFQFQERSFLFQEHSMLVTWPLDDNTALFGRTFRRKRNAIQHLTSVSCKQCRGTKWRIIHVVYTFNIAFYMVCALWVPFFHVRYVFTGIFTCITVPYQATVTWIAYLQVIRQASIECVERGQLLSKLRQRYADLLNRVIFK